MASSRILGLLSLLQWSQAITSRQHWARWIRPANPSCCCEQNVVERKNRQNKYLSSGHFLDTWTLPHALNSKSLKASYRSTIDDHQTAAVGSPHLWTHTWLSYMSQLCWILINNVIWNTMTSYQKMKTRLGVLGRTCGFWGVCSGVLHISSRWRSCTRASIDASVRCISPS